VLARILQRAQRRHANLTRADKDDAHRAFNAAIAPGRAAHGVESMIAPLIYRRR
jgi:hypothetical protein